MQKISRLLFVFVILCLSNMRANAEVSFNSTRVLAEDVLATAEFYEQAFGLQEVQRLNLSGGRLELMLNFGATEQAARDNTDAQVVIMHREPGTAPDPVTHLIFNVTEIDKTVAAVKAAGGSVTREPFEFGDTGIFISIVADPAGNLVELLQQP